MSTEAKKQTRTPVGAPCWIEFMASEPQRLKEFYAALFPAWQFLPVATESDASEKVVHFMFEQPSGLYGGIVKRPEGVPKPKEHSMGAGATVYFYVDSIDEIDTKIARIGGMKVFPKTPTGDGNGGFYANFKDTENNVFGVYEGRNE